jgi:hypothetical protein
MEEFFTTPKVLEIGFDALSAAAGIFVVATALRVASAFTLSAHRQAMQVLAAAAVIVVVSEIVGITAALTRPSTLTDAAAGLRGARRDPGRRGRAALPESRGAGGDLPPQTLRGR